LRDHLLLSDPEKAARRELADGTARELAFALALELDAEYR
jgi:hypothetical protein